MTHHDVEKTDPILALARLRDPVGVLTVMVSLHPGSRSDAFPGRRLVHDALRSLDDTGQIPDGEMVAACRQRRDEITERVEDMCDARQTGRGRVLVVPLTGSAQQLNVWEDIPDSITLSVDAHVSPLLGLREHGRPVGLVMVSSARVVVAERAMGLTRTVGTFDLSDEGVQPGSAAAPAEPVQHQETERHLKSRAFARRLTRHRKDLLAAHADELAQLAAAGGWWAIAMCGDPELTEPVRSHLAARGIEVVVSKVIPGEGWTVVDVERALHPELDHAARARRQETAAHALSVAYTRAGAGVSGVDDVLEALIEGRAHHLIVAPDLLPTTYEQMPDGRLAAQGEYPAGVLHGLMRRLPGLCDRMVAEAVLHDGQVTCVDAAESPDLAAAGGAVALLRGESAPGGGRSGGR
jgi:hypothetical protein